MRIVRDTPFEVGYVVWQLKPPAISCTIVVKATFDLVADGRATIARAQQPCTGDAHFEDELDRAVRTESDLALLKPQGEALLCGSCNPGGGSATISAITFGVGAINKMLAVYGDRFWKQGAFTTMTDPLPFATMPLSWERCFGGPGLEDNPLGVGAAPVETPEGPLHRVPNIFDPKAPILSLRDRPAPAGAFPIPRTWASRLRKAGTYDARWQKTRWPWFPVDFDPAFFLAAPPDQRIEGYWRGDEEIRLMNVVRGQPVVRTRLPGLRARAFLVAPASAAGSAGATKRFREVPLVLDTITVDGDAGAGGVAVCLYRGATTVQSEKLADVETLFVVHEPTTARTTEAEWQVRLEDLLAAEKKEEDRAAVPPPPPPA